MRCVRARRNAREHKKRRAESRRESRRIRWGRCDFDFAYVERLFASMKQRLYDGMRYDGMVIAHGMKTAMSAPKWRSQG